MDEEHRQMPGVPERPHRQGSAQGPHPALQAGQRQAPPARLFADHHPGLPRGQQEDAGGQTEPGLERMAAKGGVQGEGGSC